jgi:hypothetical protein
VTHPFHPLCGQDFEFVVYRQNWGEDRVHLHDENGQLFSLPAGWTDVVPLDPFVVIAAGRCPMIPARQAAQAGFSNGAPQDVRECTLDSAAHVKPEHATGAGPSVAVRGKPTVHTDRPRGRTPSAICPWTPRHRDLQRYKVTHDGTAKKRPA